MAPRQNKVLEGRHQYSLLGRHPCRQAAFYCIVHCPHLCYHEKVYYMHAHCNNKALISHRSFWRSIYVTPIELCTFLPIQFVCATHSTPKGCETTPLFLQWHVHSYPISIVDCLFFVHLQVHKRTISYFNKHKSKAMAVVYLTVFFGMKGTLDRGE